MIQIIYRVILPLIELIIPKHILNKLITPSSKNKSIAVNTKFKSNATFIASLLFLCFYGDSTAKNVSNHGDA